jgi:Cys-tRNA(Pro) deacylase
MVLIRSGMPFPAETDTRLAGVNYQPHRHGPVSSLEEAAALRGLPPSGIIKTIVVRRGDNDYVLVLVPGDRVIDWTKLRAHLGERRLSMPDAAEALAATGYVRGTITPCGATHEWPVVADAAVVDRTVSIGGGDHGLSLTMGGSELVECLAADVADVTKPMRG